MCPEHPPAARAGQNSGEFPPLLLRHQEAHAPTYGAIQSDHGLYDLAAWALHHAGELSPEQRAAFMHALARAWPRPPGRPKGVRPDGRSGSRILAQQAHYWIREVKLSPSETARMLGVTVDHAERSAREFVSEADAEHRHAKSGGHDEYGIPEVVVAEGRQGENVPDRGLLGPGWHGQAMLSDRPAEYRRRLDEMLDRHRSQHLTDHGEQQRPRPLSDVESIELWDKIADEEREQVLPPPTLKDV